MGNVGSVTAPIEFNSYPAISTTDISHFSTLMKVQPWSIAYTYGPFSGVGAESSLDVQYIAANAPGNTQYYW